MPTGIVSKPLFMVDMAMHMMDIAQNSIRAGAKNIYIVFNENSENRVFTFSVKDDGVGMSEDKLSKLTDPFFTTRTNRRVGLGIPFLKMVCEQTGGSIKVSSKVGEGTLTEAIFKSDSPDCLPQGDIAGYLALLIRSNRDIRIKFDYGIDDKIFSFDSKELSSLGIDLTLPDMTELFKSLLIYNLNDVFKYRSKHSMIC